MSFSDYLRDRKIRVVEEIIPHLINKTFSYNNENYEISNIKHDSTWHHLSLGLNIIAKQSNGNCENFFAKFFFKGVGPERIFLYPDSTTIFDLECLANIVFENQIKLH